MLRSLRKAAQSLERGMETAFSTTPASHAAYVNTTLTIGAKRVRLGPVFAEGGFSFVHIATPAPAAPACTTRYAVKRLSCADPDAAAQARREADFLAALPPHPNVVAFHGAAFHSGHAFLLFDLVDGGTLPEVLARPHRPFPPDKLLAILGDAVAAVAHLHAQEPPVAVRDVKLENLLYDRLAKCYKLCDFGSVSTAAARYTSRQQILAAEDDIANSCTPMYRAPELVDLYSKEFICERVDVWALGCVWYGLLFGNLPFDGLSSLQIMKGLQYVPQEPKFPPGYLELLKAMLTVSPADRPDAFTVLERVRQLQGQEIDPELKRRGQELRKRRSRDFATSSSSAPGDSSQHDQNTDLLGSGSPLPTGAKPTKLSPTPKPDVIDFATFSAETPAVKQSPPTTSTQANWAFPTTSSLPPVQPQPAAVKSNDNWADFDSAFGSGASNVPSHAPQLARRTQAEADNLHPPTGHNKTTSLIDFSDLHITPPMSKQEPQGPGRPAAQPQRQQKPAARSAPDFSDLIDFS